MKRIFLIVLILISAKLSYSQYPTPYQSLGSINIAVRDTGGLFVRQTFVPPYFVDTLSANSNNFTKYYKGSVIITSDNKTWIRNFTANQWVQVGNTSNQWLLTGNSGTTSANFLGTIDNVPLYLRVNNDTVAKFGTNSRVSFGRNIIQGGYNSTSFGEASYASGDFSTAMGSISEARGDYSIAMGRADTALGLYSIAAGYSNIAGGDYSTSMGQNNTSYGNNSFSAGHFATSSGESTIAMGLSVTASGTGATAMGVNTSASGNYATARGHAAYANGFASYAFGEYAQSNGTNSVVIGSRDTTSGKASVLIGSGLTNTTDSTIVLGFPNTHNLKITNLYNLRNNVGEDSSLIVTSDGIVKQKKFTGSGSPQGFQSVLDVDSRLTHGNTVHAASTDFAIDSALDINLTALSNVNLVAGTDNYLDVSNTGVLMGSGSTTITIDGSNNDIYSSSKKLNLNTTDSGYVNIGYANIADSNQSYALGSENNVHGNNSTAIGNGNYITTDSKNSYCFGSGNASEVDSAMSIGFGVNAPANTIGIGGFASNQTLYINNQHNLNNNSGLDSVLTTDENGVLQLKASSTATLGLQDVITNNPNLTSDNVIDLGTNDLHLDNGQVYIGSDTLKFKRNTSVGVILLDDLDAGNSNVILGVYDTIPHPNNSCTFIGSLAGRGVTATAVTVVGSSAGYGSTGVGLSAVGENAGVNNSGTFAVGIGENAVKNNSGNYAIGIGENALENNIHDYAIGLGFGASVDGAKQLALNLDNTNNIRFPFDTITANRNIRFQDFNQKVIAYDSANNKTVLYGNVYPQSDSAYDLGSSSKRWKDIYLTGGTLHLGNANISDSGYAVGKVPTASSTGKVVWRTPSTTDTTSLSDRINNRWANTGNTIANGNFIGGTNNRSLLFKSNNTQGIVLDSLGNVGIGTSPTFTVGSREKLLVDCGTTTSINAIGIEGTINSYFQNNIQNKSTGTSASSDVVATADNGDESSNYVDMGINGSGYTGGTMGVANDAYVYNIGQDMLIGAGSSGKSLVLLTGGTSKSTNARLTIDGSGNTTIATLASGASTDSVITSSAGTLRKRNMTSFVTPSDTSSMLTAYRNAINSGVSTTATKWGTSGNSGLTVANYLGTSDAQSLYLGVNGTKIFKIDSALNSTTYLPTLRFNPQPTIYATVGQTGSTYAIQLSTTSTTINAPNGNIVLAGSATSNMYIGGTYSNIAKPMLLNSAATGSTAPATTSILDLTSTTKGFLPPRMTTTQRDAISSPAEGLIIYNTTTHKLNVFTTAWEQITSL